MFRHVCNIVSHAYGRSYSMQLDVFSYVGELVFVCRLFFCCSFACERGFCTYANLFRMQVDFCFRMHVECFVRPQVDVVFVCR